MSQAPNPFCNRGVITDPDDFFGRENQIAEIITRLGTMQSTSVVGERRIGKSSLLYHLCQTGVRRLNDASYRFCYVDLQDAHYHTALGFFQTVLHKLEVPADAVKPDNSLNGNLVAFSDQIDALEKAGQRLVFCLDEFENTFKHREQFSEDFFDHIRAQLNTRKMAFVTATQRTLQSLSLEGKLTSPFYNLFTVVEVKEFTADEAQEFLVFYDKSVSFSDEELMFILSNVETHPLKLQIVCDWVVRNRERGLDEDALTEEIAREYGNFLVGRFDPKNLRKAKRLISRDNIKKLLDAIKSVRGE
jgi:AAA+ ATPase superfamily predicted ATPase